MRTTRLEKFSKNWFNLIIPLKLVNLRSYDVLLAYLSFLLGTAVILTLIIIRLYQPIGLAVTIQITSAGYLLLRKYLFDTINEHERLTFGTATINHPFFFKMLSVIVLAISALFVIYGSINSLQRPAWVFFILAILPGFILSQKFLTLKTKSGDFFILIQILILTIILVISGITVFPYNGGDTWAHLHDAKVVLQNHTLQAIAGAYKDYPLYPTYLAVFSTLTGFRTVEIARFLNVIVAVICILLLYSLTKEFGFSSYQSLVLVLLLLGSKWFIYWLLLVVSMTTGILFFCLLVVLLFRRLRGRADPNESIVLFLLTGIIPFFHPVVSVATIILFIGFWFLETFTKNKQFSVSQHSLIGLIIFVVVVTLAQWMYFGEFVFGRTITALASAIFFDGESSIRLADSFREPVVYTLDQLNFFLLLILAGIGILNQIRLKKEKSSLYAGFLGLLFVTFGYLTQIVNLQAVLPHRWLLFGTILLVLPASSTFVALFRRDSRRGRVFALIGLIIYFFLGLVNTETNHDRPFYGKSVTQQLELSSSDYAGMLALQEITYGREVDTRVDFRLWDYLKFIPENERIGYWNQIQLDEFNGIFSFRRAYLDRSLFVGDSVFNLDRNQQDLTQFYDSGDMQILERASKSDLKR